MTRPERMVETAAGRIPEKVAITYMRRNMLWSWIMRYCETRWLKSHGWIQVRDGWLLPHWHPKLKGKKNYKFKAVNFASVGPLQLGGTWVKDISLRSVDYLGKRGPIEEVGEPYDLNHALNSQRKHTEIRSTVTMLPTPSHEAPAFPSYVRWRPFQLAIFSIGNLAGLVASLLYPHWSCSILFLVAAALTGASCFFGWKARREWELDWAESQLNRGTSCEVHRGN